MAKDKTINPATAALKASKKREIKKSKANVEKQRAERTARRNPHRVQRQIDELRQAQETLGQLKPRDKQTLEQLEREHKAILKARDALGERAPVFREPRREEREGGGTLEKRRRGGEHEHESETDEDVRDIPMPNDVENMPPVPRSARRRESDKLAQVGLSLPRKPDHKSQMIYESAAAIKDLRQEATKAFVPSAVTRNLKHTLPEDNSLNEEHETKRTIKQAAFADAQFAVEEAIKEAEYEMMAQEIDIGFKGDPAQEDQIAGVQLRNVQIEEVEDNEHCYRALGLS